MMGVLDDDYDQIVDWMVQYLDRHEIDHRMEPVAYDNLTVYDHFFYAIVAVARTTWTSRVGYVPSDEALFRAFFEAEKRRLSNPLQGKPSGWGSRVIAAIKGLTV